MDRSNPNSNRSSVTLPRGFRRMPLAERQSTLSAALGFELPPGLVSDFETSAVADLLVENSIGTFPVPLALATGFRIDGENLSIPLATEEASVVAAASYMGRMLSEGNGIVTETDPAIATVQLFLEEVSDDAETKLGTALNEVGSIVNDAVASLVKRGGGFRGLRIVQIPNTLKIEIDLDVCDAMGANKVNTAGEALRPFVEHLTGGRVLMAVVTNASRRALVRARGKVPLCHLGRGALSGQEVAQRIVRATEVATFDHDRAITHNKGVLNGITALTLATGNDTRSVEAAVHGWAASSEGYKPLTRYQIISGELKAEIECPLLIGTVGGAVDIHPISRLALKILGTPSARRLAAIAAAVGLAQNLAALRALVSEGIQEGHMGLHAERLAYSAGARGTEVSSVAVALAAADKIDLSNARRLLATHRLERD